MMLRRPFILVWHAKSCFTTWLISQAKQTNPLFLLFMILNNFHASSMPFSKTKSSPFETAFHVWHRRKTTVSSHFLAPHFSPLHQFLNNLLKRLSFRLSPRLLCLFRYQLFYKTLEVLLTISNIFNESLTSGTVPSEFIQNSRRKTLVKETITWSKWT